MRAAIAKKREIVENLKNLLREYENIFLIAFELYPASMLAEIRKELRGHGKLKFGKISMIKRAIDELSEERPELEALKGYLKGKTFALLLLKPGENALDRVRRIYKKSVHLPAKGGMIAPNDIIVPAMKTNLRVSGQLTMELQGLGIKTKVERGFITIVEDAKLVEAGERIPEAIARVLNMLGLKPIESRPEIVAGIFEKLLIPGEYIIEFDPERIAEIASKAIAEATKLASEAGIITPKTLEVAIPNAVTRAAMLAASIGIPTQESLRLLVPKAVAVAKALKEKANIE